MTPDIRLNGASVAGMGIYGLAPRNHLLPATTISDQYDYSSGKKFSHSLHRSSGAYILSASELLFDVFHAGNKKNL